jgi:hypothetical protein
MPSAHLTLYDARCAGTKDRKFIYRKSRATYLKDQIDKVRVDQPSTAVKKIEQYRQELKAIGGTPLSNEQLKFALLNALEGSNYKTMTQVFRHDASTYEISKEKFKEEQRRLGGGATPTSKTAVFFGTKDRKLIYRKTSEKPVYGAVDASYASGHKARSRTGMALFRGGAAYVWKTKVQTVPAISATEAEYMASTTAVQYICWTRELLKECGWETTEPTLLQIDNQQAIKMGELVTIVPCIAVRDLFLNHHVEEKTVRLEWVPGTNNVADVLTKGLAGQCFKGTGRHYSGRTPHGNNTINHAPSSNPKFTRSKKPQQTLEDMSLVKHSLGDGPMVQPSDLQKFTRSKTPGE